MGNLGMYATGIPSGMLVDARGARWGVAIGTVLFAAGYYPISKGGQQFSIGTKMTDDDAAFDAGPGAYSIGSLCLFSFFTGAGSCSAFTASIKAAALNFPDHRGTATAFPLAAFGLSAFLFSTIALVLPHGTSYFLRLLATGTVVLPAISFFFLHSPSSHGSYQQLPQHETQRLHSTHAANGRAHVNNPHTGTPQKQPTSTPFTRSSTAGSYTDDGQLADDSENASLLSNTSTSGPGTPRPGETKSSDAPADAPPPDLDIRGVGLLPHPEFWLLFALLGLMCGIGLMTINNIGGVAQALWLSVNPETPSSFIASRQVLHVSILSVMSFSGRLTSGIGSDVLVRKYMLSRFWCLFASSVVFICAQVAALTTANPTLLVLVSGFTGFAYGMLFGVYPSLVAHTFGVHGMSQNWGVMTLAPVISGNIFNLIFGRIYDARSVVDDKTGDRECLEGKSCYEGAYYMTLAASVGALVLCLWSIRHDNAVNRRRQDEGRRKGHGHLVD